MTSAGLDKQKDKDMGLTTGKDKSHLNVPWPVVLAVFMVSSTFALLFAVLVGPSGAAIQITVFTAISLACAIVLRIPVRESLRDLLDAGKHDPQMDDEQNDTQKESKQGNMIHNSPPVNEEIDLVLARAVLAKFEARLESGRRREQMFNAIVRLAEEQGLMPKEE